MKTLVKTSELTGPALDWAVAKCAGREIDGFGRYGVIVWELDALTGDKEACCLFTPSTDWAQGGPIIERDGMHVDCLRQGKAPVWEAWPYASGTKHIQQGPTPLIAAMRGYVASRLGDEVDVPKELVCTS